MGTGFRKRPGNKAVPYLSHEFIIQNHGDIATCFCMVFIVGLMFQASSPLASAFIAPKHNVTEITNKASTLYTYGLKDLCLLVFYTLTAIIFHAIVQEYVLDKLQRKVRLSKTKLNKFNESGQLLAFYVFSAVWALIIFRDEGYFQTFDFFWVGYPHVGLTSWTKFFFIVQMSYWVHVFPELYFQKAKREEIPSKVVFATINFLICASIYVLNLTRIGMTLLFIDYSINALFHFSRLLYFMDKKNVSKTSFNIYNVSFVLARLSAIILSIFVFWFGLKTSSVESVRFEEGNFNTPLVRTLCLVAILALQAWMLWNFILFQCKKIRENAPAVPATKSAPKPKKVKSQKEESENEVDSNGKETRQNGDANNNKIKAN